MKIVQVAGYLSIDGLFGGPLAVALEQCTELNRRGHDVSLMVAWDGIAPVPRVDFDILTFPVMRLAGRLGLPGLLSPRLVRHLQKMLPDCDVVHVHAGRDLLGASAIAVGLRQRQVHVQTHGMIVPDGRFRARAMDAVATRRQLARAGSVFYLTDAERRGLTTVTRSRAQLRQLRNGVSPVLKPDAPPRLAFSEEPVVLFCARLHPRKRVSTFLQVADLVQSKFPNARFAIAGADEGDLPQVHRFLETRKDIRCDYLGPLDRASALSQMAAADVLVLPSVDEPFPMSVLEAMARGTPAVLTDSCGISGELLELEAASVTAASPSAIAEAVSELLGDSVLWSQRSQRSVEVIKTVYSIESVVNQLLHCYSNQAESGSVRL